MLFSVEPAERRARLRTMRLALRTLCGERARAAEKAFSDAEHDEAALPQALDALNRLSPLDQRRVLSSWWSVQRQTA